MEKKANVFGAKGRRRRQEPESHDKSRDMAQIKKP